MINNNNNENEDNCYDDEDKDEDYIKIYAIHKYYINAIKILFFVRHSRNFLQDRFQYKSKITWRFDVA